MGSNVAGVWSLLRGCASTMVHDDRVFIRCPNRLEYVGRPESSST